MKVLKEIATEQTITIIPREYVSNISYTLTNESDNTSVNKDNLATFIDSGYLTITDIFDLKEGVFYNLECFYDNNGTDKLIYRGRIFCTNQTSLDKFTMNENEYVQNDTYDNEYEIYE